jgi:hypothetical protein
MEPPHLPTENLAINRVRRGWRWSSLVPSHNESSPQPGLIRCVRCISRGDKDSLAERGGFDLPVPICEQSDDGIRLRFATSRRTAKRYQPRRAFLVRFRVAGSDRGKMACPSVGSLLRHQSRCPSSHTLERFPSNVADRKADQAFEPRAISTFRPGAEDSHIMLSSGCSEMGTGSSNSPRSARESGTLRDCV